MESITRTVGNRSSLSCWVLPTQKAFSGSLRRNRYRGAERAGTASKWVATAFNLFCVAKLSVAPPSTPARA